MLNNYVQRRRVFSKTSWKKPISLPKCVVRPASSDFWKEPLHGFVLAALGPMQPWRVIFVFYTGLKIATDMVADATNIFSLATKNSGLVAKVVTRFLCDLDLN